MSVRRTFWRLPMAVCLLLTSAAAHPMEGHPDAIGDTRDAVADRLRIMPDVAKFKFARDIAVEDKAREKQVISAFLDAAHDAKLDAEFAQIVITDQIAASKEVQRRLFSQWRSSPPQDAGDIDLVRDIRPRIDQANETLLDALADLRAEARSCEQARRLEKPPQDLAAFNDAWLIAVAGIVDLYCE